MEPRVKALFSFPEKGKPGVSAECSHFTEQKGMDGDRHADGGSRQVTLLSGEVKAWMAKQKEPGLCFKRYKANLETEGLDIGMLRPGMRLFAGSAVFEVSEVLKECFPECTLLKNQKECRLSSGGAFLRVIKSGEVSKNDTIAIGGMEK